MANFCRYIHGEKNGFGIRANKQESLICAGVWRGEYLDGISTMVDDKGLRYLGTVLGISREKIGSLKSKDTLYKGNFEENEKKGLGVIYVGQHETRLGYFDRNEINGYGEISNSLVGYEYQGTFLDSLAHGDGKEDTDTDSYIGQFQIGKRHGVGEMTRKGTDYKGQWKDGTRSGYGIEVTEECEYFGHFVKGIKNGHGQQKFADGSVFVGEFINNRRHGFGKLETPQGLYIGYWRDGEKTGLGFCKVGDNFVFLGEWANNKIRHGSHNLLEEVDLQNSYDKKDRLETLPLPPEFFEVSTGKYIEIDQHLKFELKSLKHHLSYIRRHFDDDRKPLVIFKQEIDLIIASYEKAMTEDLIALEAMANKKGKNIRRWVDLICNNPMDVSGKTPQFKNAKDGTNELLQSKKSDDFYRPELKDIFAFDRAVNKVDIKADIRETGDHQSINPSAHSRSLKRQEISPITPKLDSGSNPSNPNTIENFKIKDRDTFGIDSQYEVTNFDMAGLDHGNRCMVDERQMADDNYESSVQICDNNDIDNLFAKISNGDIDVNTKSAIEDLPPHAVDRLRLSKADVKADVKVDGGRQRSTVEGGRKGSKRANWEDGRENSEDRGVGVVQGESAKSRMYGSHGHAALSGKGESYHRDVHSVPLNVEELDVDASDMEFDDIFKNIVNLDELWMADIMSQIGSIDLFGKIGSLQEHEAVEAIFNKIEANILSQSYQDTNEKNNLNDLKNKLRIEQMKKSKAMSKCENDEMDIKQELVQKATHSNVEAIKILAMKRKMIEIQIANLNEGVAN